MTPGERIIDWIEGLIPRWGAGLRNWMASWLSWGIELFFDVLGKAAAPKLKPLIDTLEATGKIPPELQPFLDEMKTPTGEVGALFAQSASSAFVGGAIGRILDALFLPLSYSVNTATRNIILSPDQLLWLWRKEYMEEPEVNKYLSWLGYNNDDIGHWKELTLFVPSADEQTLWLAREVFEPDMVEKYGLDAELPKYADTDFSKVGVNQEQMTNKWRAHWQHASFIQVVEMFRRKLITKTDFKEWFKLVEIPPFWRENLIEISKAWPTRVDVRRWWDMRTIDEARLRELYAGMGYDGKNLDDYIIWTKVFTEFPSLLARWSKGWITRDELRAQVVALGMPAARVDTFLQEKIEADQPERTANERDITKTDIYKGVKQDRITRAQGLELLQELGYDADEADYLLAINIPQDQVESVVNQRLLTKADIIAGLRADIITEDEARDRLLGLRYSAVDAQLLLDIFKATIKPPAEERQRQASKADIVLAVKKDLITAEEGYLMLLDLGFTPEASEFILMVKAESSPFSPVTFGEFKDLTSKWRKAAGMTTQTFNDKLREAADELVKISDQVKSLEIQVKAEEMLLVDQDVIPPEAEKRLKELQVALNRAISEKERLQGAYNDLVAEFRQTE